MHRDKYVHYEFVWRVPVWNYKTKIVSAREITMLYWTRDNYFCAITGTTADQRRTFLSQYRVVNYFSKRKMSRDPTNTPSTISKFTSGSGMSDVEIILGRNITCPHVVAFCHTSSFSENHFTFDYGTEISNRHSKPLKIIVPETNCTWTLFSFFFLQKEGSTVIQRKHYVVRH